MDVISGSVDRTSSSEAKIALFRSLFRGRDDVRSGRSPLILTERNDHLDRFEQELATRVDHVVVLRAGMGKKQRHRLYDGKREVRIPRLCRSQRADAGENV
jgi:hypothetical protein